MYERFADQANVDLDPAELWLLSRLGEGAAVDMRDARLESAYESLRERGLVDSRLADDGEIVYARLVEARRRGLSELLDGWEPERHDEVRAMLDRFSRLNVAEPPAVS
jgi:DNA-binding transcriptional ArsR family regulator